MTDVAGGPLAPKILVYDPLGAVAASATATDVADVAFQAPLSGTYTVVLADSSPDLNAAGDYDLYFIIAPGADKGGALAPGGGGMVAGHLDEGALDSYTFAANVGQGFTLKMTDVAGGPLMPKITVYDPTGAIAGSARANDVATLTLQVHSTGIYTVVLADSSAGFVAAGDYDLYFTIAPSVNNRGALPPRGSMVAGHIEGGALDSYTFTGAAGHSILLQMVDVAGGPLAPAITVYDPSGAIGNSFAVGEEVAESGASPDFYGEYGTYTVTLGDSSPGQSATGDYYLYYAIVPGVDVIGSLVDGAKVTAHIAKGALDAYAFDANVGDTISIEVTRVSTSSLSPGVTVYDPAGQEVSSLASFFQALSKGTYTVIVSDWSLSKAGTGDCDLAFSLTPAATK
jgi:hypothetical protein